jgi:hypothetical protein
MNGPKKEYEWTLAHDQLSSTLPSKMSHFDALPQTDQHFVIGSYLDYIDATLPLLNESQNETEKSERQSARAEIMLKFLTKEGQGSKFKGTYDRLLKNITLPKGAKEELGIFGENGMEDLVETERSI